LRRVVTKILPALLGKGVIPAKGENKKAEQKKEFCLKKRQLVQCLVGGAESLKKDC
jgi:hypothetical protein